jgi:hypothetical protein
MQVGREINVVPAVDAVVDVEGILFEPVGGSAMAGQLAGNMYSLTARLGTPAWKYPVRATGAACTGSACFLRFFGLRARGWCFFISSLAVR